MLKFEPTLEASIVLDKVARRVKAGKSLASIRAELIADGLSSDFVDQLLSTVAAPSSRNFGPIVLVVLSTAAIVLLPIAGLIGGVLFTSPEPITGPQCGMAWLADLAHQFIVWGMGGCIGLAVGTVSAFIVVWFLWSFAHRPGGGR